MICLSVSKTELTPLYSTESALFEHLAYKTSTNVHAPKTYTDTHVQTHTRTHTHKHSQNDEYFRSDFWALLSDLAVIVADIVVIVADIVVIWLI